MDFMYPNTDRMFMDENAPCHRATVVRYLFEEHCGEFDRMILLSRHKRHNRDKMERLVRVQIPAQATILQLWTTIEAARLRMSAGDFHRLVQSMSRWVAVLRRAKGGSAPY